MSEETKVTGATLVALPGKIQEYIAKQKDSKKGEYYAVYLWVDDEKALYLHGNTSYGRTSGGFMGRLASQIGSQYFVGLEAILEDKTLLDALQEVKSVQIDSKTYNWTGSLAEFLDLIGVNV